MSEEEPNFRGESIFQPIWEKLFQVTKKIKIEIEKGKTEAQRKVDEEIQLQNEIFEEQLRQNDIIDALQSSIAVSCGFSERELFGSNRCPSCKEIMDRKYPHVCFSCGRKIYYYHALGNALSIMRGEKSREEAEKQFKKWWKSDIVKFVCCSCHKNPEKIEKFIKKRERLLRQARNRAKKYKYEVSF